MPKVYIPGKLYTIVLKQRYKGIIPLQKGSLQNYPLEHIGSIPNKTLVLFVGYSRDRYDGTYLKVIYLDKVGVVAKAFATLEEP